MSPAEKVSRDVPVPPLSVFSNGARCRSSLRSAQWLSTQSQPIGHRPPHNPGQVGGTQGLHRPGHQPTASIELRQSAGSDQSLDHTRARATRPAARPPLTVDSPCSPRSSPSHESSVHWPPQRPGDQRWPGRGEHRPRHEPLSPSLQLLKTGPTQLFQLRLPDLMKTPQQALTAVSQQTRPLQIATDRNESTAQVGTPFSSSTMRSSWRCSSCGTAPPGRRRIDPVRTAPAAMPAARMATAEARRSAAIEGPRD